VIGGGSTDPSQWLVGARPKRGWIAAAVSEREGNARLFALSAAQASGHHCARFQAVAQPVLRIHSPVYRGKDDSAPVESATE